jgi:hypothetical protein
VQRRVEEGVQPEHAAEAHEDGLVRQLAQGRDRQRQHQEAQGPQPEAMFDLRDRIRAQPAAAGQGFRADLPAQYRGGYQCEQMDDALGGDHAA